MIDTTNDPYAARRAEIFSRIGVLPGADTVLPGKALALTADNTVVDQSDPLAEFVLCGEASYIPADLAKELGIKAAKPKKQSDNADDANKEAVSGLTITHDESAIPVTMGTPAPEPSAAPVPAA